MNRYTVFIFIVFLISLCSHGSEFKWDYSKKVDAPASAPSDADLRTNKCIFYIDEVADKVKVKCLESDGVTYVNEYVTSGLTPPGSSTDNAIVRFDGTGGYTIQDSGVIIDDTNNMSIPGTLDVDTISSYTADTDCTISADGTGTVNINDTMTVVGTATVADISQTGTTTQTGDLNQTGSTTISVDLDVDGTTNLDVTDIDGACDMASTLETHGLLTATGGVSTPDNTFAIKDDGDATRVLQFQLSGITASNTRTVTALDEDCTMVCESATQTLTNKTLTTPTIGDFTNAGHTHADASNGGTIDHGALTGRTDDDHTQYTLLDGRSGGQQIIGGTDANDNLTLDTTSNGTKGDYVLTDLASGIVKSTGGTLSAVTAPSGDIVGTTDTQTLSAKTLTTPTIADFTNATHDHSNNAGGGTISHTNLTDIGSNTHAQIDTFMSGTGPVLDADYTAKGDLLVGTGTGTYAALSASTNDYVLTLDSGEASGVKWAAVSSVSSSGSSGDIQISDGANGFTSEAAFNYDTGTNTLSVDNVTTATADGDINITPNGTGRTYINDADSNAYTDVSESGVGIITESGTSLRLFDFSDTPTAGPRQFFYRSRGTLASPTDISNNYVISRVWGLGRSGGAYKESYKIHNIATDVSGTYIQSKTEYGGSSDGSTWDDDMFIMDFSTETFTAPNLTLSGGLNVGSDALGDMYYRNSSGNFTRIPAGSEDDVLTMGASSVPGWEANPGISEIELIRISYTVANETGGGTATSGAWRKLSFNTEDADTMSSSSTDLANDEVDLSAGKYRIQCSVNSYDTGSFQAKLYNESDSTDDGLYGTIVDANTFDDTTATSILDVYYSLAGTKSIAIYYRAQTTNAGDGLGIPSPASWGGLQKHRQCTFTKLD